MKSMPAATLTSHRALLHNQSGAHTQYLAALEAYWDERPLRTMKLIAEALVSNQGTATQFPLYRLWIEQSAQRNEMDSLHSLLQFLLEESVTDADITWVALRGLIHLELEEIGACKLLLPFLAKEAKNPYCLEFLCKYHNRTSAAYYGFSLRNTQLPSLDYFHWLPVLSHAPVEAETFAFLAEAFPHSPLVTFCQLQHALATMPKKTLIAYTQTELEALHTRYSHSHTWQYCANTWKALHTKKRADAQTVAQGEHRMEPRLYQLFRGFVAAGGLAPLLPNEQKDSLESANLPATPYKAEEPETPALQQQSWLFLLSPHAYYEWMQDTSDGIREIPAAPSMQHRDTICWGSSFTESSKTGYRIGGLLEVLTAPKFHPLWKHSVSVRLLDHQGESIPLELFLAKDQLHQVESANLAFCLLKEAEFIAILSQMERHQGEKQVEVEVEVPIQQYAEVS